VETVERRVHAEEAERLRQDHRLGQRIAFARQASGFDANRRPRVLVDGPLNGRLRRFELLRGQIEHDALMWIQPELGSSERPTIPRGTQATFSPGRLGPLPVRLDDPSRQPEVPYARQEALRPPQPIHLERAHDETFGDAIAKDDESLGRAAEIEARGLETELVERASVAYSELGGTRQDLLKELWQTRAWDSAVTQDRSQVVPAGLQPVEAWQPSVAKKLEERLAEPRGAIPDVHDAQLGERRRPVLSGREVVERLVDQPRPDHQGPTLGDERTASELARALDHGP